MTHKEWIDWLKYFERNGRLDPIRLYDRGAAQLCSIVTNALGGSGTMQDFLPYKPKQSDVIATIGDFVKEFGGVKDVRPR